MTLSNIENYTRMENNEENTYIDIIINQLINELSIEETKKHTLLQWDPWTQKSKNIEFKSTIKGVGDGEEKLAAEFSTTVLGQNSNYDMIIKLKSNDYMCDVKKLDNYTFNTGVDGRNQLTPIKNQLLHLLPIFYTIPEYKKLSEITPDEVCNKNVKMIYNACVRLHKYMLYLQSKLKLIIVKPFAYACGESIEMSLDKYYKICKLLGISFPTKYEKYKKDIEILNYISSHDYIQKPIKFINDLQDLKSVLKDILIVFVDEKKGYCIWNDISKIDFERITRGHPRFRVFL